MPARLIALAVLAAGTLTAGLAVASTPESGKVSNASPRVDWSGESNGYGYYNYARVARTGGQQPRCDAPACDEFTLEVADSADLTISATYEATVFLDLDIILPDGSSQYVDGSDDKNTTIAKIKKAKPGTYLVRVTTNGSAAADGAFTAFAQLAVPAAAAPAPAPAAPAPAPEPAPAPAPAPAAPAPAGPASSSAQLTIGTRGASLRKLKKRSLTVAVSTSAPVTNVQAFLRKGKKVVAKGKLARLDGKGKVKLKLSKKVKPGRYVLGLSAKTASGGTAAASAPIKLKR